MVISMKSLFAWLSLWLASPALSDTAGFVLTSTSDTASYAVLVMAPETHCAASRVVLSSGGASWKSPTLAPGELAVVRIGSGFAPGDHAVRMQVLGCDQPAFAARRVILSKHSPDHGWRGGALN
jgi:hypothetical protein